MGLNGIYYIVPHDTTYIKILSTGKVSELSKIECHSFKGIGYGFKIYSKSSIQIQPIFDEIEIYDTNGTLFKDTFYFPNLEKTNCVISRDLFDINIISKLKDRIERHMKAVYCYGTKKNGIPCKRYLGKVEGKAELLCPICKTMNLVEN